MAYIVRFSAHIQEDINRNWSSWNFGKEGVNANRESLLNLVNDAIENQDCFYASGFEVWPTSVIEKDDEIVVKQGSQKFILRELYNDYWVVVDDRGGICFLEEEFQSLEEAIAYAEGGRHDFSEGVFYDADEVSLIASQKPEGEYGWHIFEI